MEPLLSPQNDVVFKLLFSKPENNDLLVAFLTAALEPASPIAEAKVINPAIEKENILEKSTILDVAVELQNGSKIDIEMQVEKKLNFRQRILFYLSRLHQSQLKPGHNHALIRPSIAIAVLGYTETTESHFHSIYDFRERTTGSLFSDCMSVHLL